MSPGATAAGLSSAVQQDCLVICHLCLTPLVLKISVQKATN